MSVLILREKKVGTDLNASHCNIVLSLSKAVKHLPAPLTV